MRNPRWTWFGLLGGALLALGGCGSDGNSSPDANPAKDAAAVDAPHEDAASPDATTADSAAGDAALPDAAVGDAATPDATSPKDAATPDGAAGDAATGDAAAGCSCQAGHYCEYASGCSGATTCVAVPALCPMVSSLVCGCDDKTYFSACLASQAGVTVKSQGACPGAAVCSSTAECNSNEFCNKLPGDCSGQGLCKTKSAVCPAPTLAGKICGCDNKTYSNACLANLSGTSVKSPEECSTATFCTNDAQCQSTAFCKSFDGACGAMGRCTEKPSMCPTTQAQVCGCDGNTYLNACMARKSGVSISYAAACAVGSCSSNNECSFPFYCSKGAGDCFGMGSCDTPPEFCTTADQPVCGCNGVTYPNACGAHQFGVNVAKDGEC